jgi:beta-phosphoglucomutase-like phosphatase (HAD superfamily)
MTSSTRPGRPVTTLLCDADGTLFDTEARAFVASAVVTQQFADRYGLLGDFTPEHLRKTTTGRNFRSTAGMLLLQAGVHADHDELEDWVGQEREAVTRHLGTVITSDSEVSGAVEALSRRFRLAAVSSSALGRLDACFRASHLDSYFPPGMRFSAENSMERPVSKPDPAIYRFALRALDVAAEESIAIEDSPTGAASAVAAGIRTIGLLHFVPLDERDAAARALLDAGVSDIALTWADAVALLDATATATAVAPRSAPRSRG